VFERLGFTETGRFVVVLRRASAALIRAFSPFKSVRRLWERPPAVYRQNGGGPMSLRFEWDERRAYEEAHG
jgi:hypothetical protein